MKYLVALHRSEKKRSLAEFFKLQMYLKYTKNTSPSLYDESSLVSIIIFNSEKHKKTDNNEPFLDT